MAVHVKVCDRVFCPAEQAGFLQLDISSCVESLSECVLIMISTAPGSGLASLDCVQTIARL